MCLGSTSFFGRLWGSSSLTSEAYVATREKREEPGYALDTGRDLVDHRNMESQVTVPDVVGLPFHVARDVASGAEVALANPDPDGPPIAALAWPGLFYITSQNPLPGAQVDRWESVRVEISAFGPSDRGAVLEPHPPAPTLRAHAETQPRAL